MPIATQGSSSRIKSASMLHLKDLRIASFHLMGQDTNNNCKCKNICTRKLAGHDSNVITQLWPRHTSTRRRIVCGRGFHIVSMCAAIHWNFQLFSPTSDDGAKHGHWRGPAERHDPVPTTTTPESRSVARPAFLPPPPPVQQQHHHHRLAQDSMRMGPAEHGCTLFGHHCYRRRYMYGRRIYRVGAAAVDVPFTMPYFRRVLGNWVVGAKCRLGKSWSV